MPPSEGHRLCQLSEQLEEALHLEARSSRRGSTEYVSQHYWKDPIGKQKELALTSHINRTLLFKCHILQFFVVFEEYLAI